MKVYAESRDYQNNYAFFFRAGDGVQVVVRGNDTLETVRYEEGIARVSAESLLLPRDITVGMFQALWDEGLRPKDFKPKDETDLVAALKHNIEFAEKTVDTLLS